jgi:predicted ArsR family transcriptional regulator
MAKSRRGGRVLQVAATLDAEITAMVDRVRQVFGEEVLEAIYDRARNAAIRQASPRETPASMRNDSGLRLVSNTEHDGFVRALRDELDRALTHH